MTVGIRPYAGHNGCALTKAIRDHTDERKGIKEHLTLETIHPMTRLWLTRRGFAIDEDISLLQEKEGGSLSNAILVLMHVTPRHFQNATTISSMNSFHRSGKRHDPEFNVDGAQLEAVRDPWAQLNEKLPVDCDHPRNDVIQNVRSREKELEYNVWEANIREDLETSRIFLDDDGILIFAVEISGTPWARKKSPVLVPLIEASPSERSLGKNSYKAANISGLGPKGK